MLEAKILLVDDDVELAGIVREFLQSKGFGVDMHHSVEAAWNGVLQNSYDIILLDLELPDGSGFDFCRLYRDSGGIAPILMMTGRKELDNKEEGLESGADDYLTKPVSLRELHARIKSMLRRANTYLPPSRQDTMEEPEPGLVIAEKYRLEKTIGAGGMAIIWLATDLNMQRLVVVKLMRGYLVGQGETQKRFIQEGRMLAKVQDPNIVAVHDAGCLQQRIPYLVMEYVEGESLRCLIEKRYTISVQDTITIIMQLCAGLDKVHSAGVVHRDLKPENILLQSKSNTLIKVKLADFGIAKLFDTNHSEQRLTREGIVVGTVDYMSPEQLQDRAVDHRSDIYSVGMIMYEMLTGRLPFGDDTSNHQKAMFHVVQKPDPVSAICQEIEPGAGLDPIVEKCLQKEAEERYQSAAELKTALLQLLWK